MNLVICLTIVQPGTMVIATAGMPYLSISPSLYLVSGKLTYVCSEEGHSLKECDQPLTEEFSVMYEDAVSTRMRRVCRIRRCY